MATFPAEGRWTVSKLLEAMAERASDDVSPLLNDPEVRTAIRQALTELSERQQSVIGLLTFEGLSYEEVADVLGVTPVAIENVFVKAVLDLRVRLIPVLPAKSSGLVEALMGVRPTTSDLDDSALGGFLAELERDGALVGSRVARRTPSSSLESVPVTEDASRWVIQGRR